MGIMRDQRRDYVLVRIHPRPVYDGVRLLAFATGTSVDALVNKWTREGLAKESKDLTG